MGTIHRGISGWVGYRLALPRFASAIGIKALQNRYGINHCC